MNRKKILISIILVAIIIVIGILLFKKNLFIKSIKNNDSSLDQVAALKAQQEVKYKESMQSLNKVLEKARETDSDLDGLSDVEEKKLGTNPDFSDSDHDGLSDGDEVKTFKTDPLKPDTDGDSLQDGLEVRVYHTDPLKADTDGDGHDDGVEVKNGYNPLGDGKLKKLF